MSYRTSTIPANRFSTRLARTLDRQELVLPNHSSFAFVGLSLVL